MQAPSTWALRHVGTPYWQVVLQTALVYRRNAIYDGQEKHYAICVVNVVVCMYIWWRPRAKRQTRNKRKPVVTYFWASDQVCIVQTRVYTYILSGSICKYVCLRVKFKIRDARKRLCFTEFEYIKVIHAWVNKFHIPHIYNECYLSIF